MVYSTLGYQDGPDRVRPAESYTTVRADCAVKLRIPETGAAIERQPAISVPTLLRRTAERYPDHVALVHKADAGEWRRITFTQYLADVRTAAKAFLRLGLERHHSVCVLGFNSPAWFVSDLGAIFAGGIAAGIYTTNSADACRHCLHTSRANICVVEDDVQLQKVLSVRDRLPLLKAIVQYTGAPKDPTVYSWQQLMELGAREDAAGLDAVIRSLAPNECCTLVFTSGTVGQPKAVMLSHDNLIWDAQAITERAQMCAGCERLVSYLPLSHVAAQVLDVYVSITIAAEVWFADRSALKGTLVETMREVQPTRFLGVPRVWEKMHEGILAAGKARGRLSAALVAWAKGHALQYHADRLKGIDAPSWSYHLAAALVFRQVKAALGLSQCRSCYTAAAPLADDVKRHFLSVDIPLLEVYGMSEVSGAHVENALALPGVHTRIEARDAAGEGEICMRGRHVFMGYLGEQAQTAEALDADGWLRSGDLGRVDAAGRFCITGRLKELLITAGGENVPPTPIEGALRAQLPMLGGVMLVGDRRRFLGVLVALRTAPDENGAPTDALAPCCQEWLRELGCPARTASEALAGGPHAHLAAAIQRGVDAANELAVSNAQRIQKFAIIERDFSVATGELGPTLKLRRDVVAEKYRQLIDAMYA